MIKKLKSEPSTSGKMCTYAKNELFTEHGRFNPHPKSRTQHQSLGSWLKLSVAGLPSAQAQALRTVITWPVGAVAVHVFHGQHSLVGVCRISAVILGYSNLWKRGGVVFI